MTTPIRNVSKGKSHTITMGLYGEPGIGKTRLVGSCGALGRTLILRPPIDHTDSIIDTNNVDEWVINDWAEADDALMYCRTEGAAIYDWVWLDSLSLWSDQGIDDIWEQLIHDKPHRARWGLDKGEYWLNMQRIQRWIRHMVGCPDWHFGFTAHVERARVSENEEDDTEKLMPYIQGKNMASKMCAYTNIVGYMHWEKVGRSGTEARVLSLDSTSEFYAKDQFNTTDNGRMVNPTMTKIAEGIVAHNKAKSPATTKRAPARRRPTK